MCRDTTFQYNPVEVVLSLKIDETEVNIFKEYNFVPSFNLSPSFFSQLTMVPISMVGDSAGKSTLKCSGNAPFEYFRTRFLLHSFGLCKDRRGSCVRSLLKKYDIKFRNIQYIINIGNGISTSL